MVATAKAALMAGQATLRKHKGEWLPSQGGRYCTITEGERDLIAHAKPDDDCCESLLGLLGDAMVGRPRFDRLRLEGLAFALKLKLVDHLGAMPIEERNTWVLLGKALGKKHRARRGNMEHHRRRLYNQVIDKKLLKRTKKQASRAKKQLKHSKFNAMTQFPTVESLYALEGLIESGERDGELVIQPG